MEHASSQDERIASIRWLARLSPGLRADLLARGRISRRAAGEWLYGEGDADTGLVVVLEGGLHIYTEAPGGRDVLIGMVRPGGVFGRSAMVVGGGRLVTAIASSDSVLFVLSDRALHAVEADHEELRPVLGALLVGQLRNLLRLLAETVTLKPRERMIARLLDLSVGQDGVQISQSALAEMIGVTRKAVNGWLCDLEARGVVGRGYGRITVRDRPALERMVPG